MEVPENAYMTQIRFTVKLSYNKLEIVLTMDMYAEDIISF